MSPWDDETQRLRLYFQHPNSFQLQVIYSQHPMQHLCLVCLKDKLINILVMRSFVAPLLVVNRSKGGNILAYIVSLHHTQGLNQ